MRSIFKKKRFWFGVSSAAAAIVYFLDGNYIAAAKSVLAGIAG